jgi:hypothetical protein
MTKARGFTAHFGKMLRKIQSNNILYYVYNGRFHYVNNGAKSGTSSGKSPEASHFIESRPFSCPTKGQALGPATPQHSLYIG